MLGTAVFLWSTITFMTPTLAEHSVGMVAAGRVLLGLVEGVMYPAIYTYVANK